MLRLGDIWDMETREKGHPEKLNSASQLNVVEVLSLEMRN